MPNLRDIMARTRYRPPIDTPVRGQVQPEYQELPATPPMAPPQQARPEWRTGMFALQRQAPPQERAQAINQGFMQSSMFGAKRPPMSMRDILMGGASRARRR